MDDGKGEKNSDKVVEDVNYSTMYVWGLFVYTPKPVNINVMDRSILFRATSLLCCQDSESVRIEKTEDRLPYMYVYKMEK